MDFLKNSAWTNEPQHYFTDINKIKITTSPKTDLWQRTYYGFKHDNAPILQKYTKEDYFSFTVKTEFDSKYQYDQCGIVVYLNNNSWMKASCEYEDGLFQNLGTVVTNGGYSDWSMQRISSDIKTIWYRLSRRLSDYSFEFSLDGSHFKQMRICHFFDENKEISFGVYACSPGDSRFNAIFSEIEITTCKWDAHIEDN